MKLRRTLPSLAAAVVLSMTLVGCGGDDQGSDSGSSDSSASSSTGASGSADPSAAGGSSDGAQGGDQGGSDGADGSGSAGSGSNGGSGSSSNGGSGSGGTAKGAGDFCAAVDGAVKVVSTTQGGMKDEASWKKVQTAYAALADVDLPKSATKDNERGRDVLTKAIGETSFAEAKKLMASGNVSTIPGASPADTKLAQDFFLYAAKTCAGTLGQ